MISIARRSAGTLLIAALALAVDGASRESAASSRDAEPATPEQVIREAVKIFRSRGVGDPRQRALAFERYREAVAQLLPVLKENAEPPLGRDLGKFLAPKSFSQLTPVESRASAEGLCREGFGLPVIGRLMPSRIADPNAPRSGYLIAATALVVPKADGTLGLLLADPQRLETIDAFETTLPVAMNLEAWLDAVEAAGPQFGQGVRYMLRSNRFAYPSQLAFLEPFNPAKTPVVLVHGLMSTPRMWAPVLKGLLAHGEIRERYQFWFFYYPTGQPVPFSALQLREALTEAASRHRLRKPLVLIGHSMGGIVVRAQVSRISAFEAGQVLPGIAELPAESLARRAIIFEPRKDVSRVIFIATPHRGSRVAQGRLAALGNRMINLPDRIASELGNLASQLLPERDGRLPTSIHGLSPDSMFLQALNRYRPAVPCHSIIGARRHRSVLESSDGIVPYISSHLDFADSEVLIPAGHGGFSHPEAIAEMVRILKLTE